MIKVLIVDDHAIVREGFVRLITSDPAIEVCGEAGSAEEAYSMYVSNSPDVVISDLAMKGLSGMSLLQKILSRDKHAKVIICSMYDDSSLIASALSNGASGFISKSSDPAHIVSAIHTVYAGGTYLSDELNAKQHNNTQAKETGLIKQLSSKEFEIFKMLAEGKSITDCANTLYLSEKTVNNYQTAIRVKLKVETAAALVHFAHRNGVIKSFQ